MPEIKIKKKSTMCKHCGKSVSHNANDKPYEVCYTCRNSKADEDFELELWHMMTGQKPTASFKRAC